MLANKKQMIRWKFNILIILIITICQLGCSKNAVDPGITIKPRNISPFEQQFLIEKFNFVNNGEELPSDVQNYLKSRFGVLLGNESRARLMSGGYSNDFAFAFTELDGAITYHTLTIFIYKKEYNESLCRYALTRTPKFSELKNIFNSNKVIIKSDCDLKKEAG